MQNFYRAHLDNGSNWEGDTLADLIGAIVHYYGDGDTSYCPLATSLILSTPDSEIELTPLEVEAFNRELEGDFEDAVLECAYTADYVRGVSSMAGRL